MNNPLDPKKMPLCGCGTCNDAMDVAMKIAEEHFKGDNCSIFAAGVAQALKMITGDQMIVKLAHTGGEAGVDRAATMMPVVEREISTSMVAIHYNNPEMLERRCGLILDDMPDSELKPVAESFLREPPSKETLAEMGYDVTDDGMLVKTNPVEKLLRQLFGAEGAAIFEATKPKTH